MRRLFLLLTALLAVLLTYKTEAQTHLILRTDSTRIKMASDGSEKFIKNDSAYLALEAKRKTAAQFSSDSLALNLKNCEFEKEANAEILFDQAGLFFAPYGAAMEHYRRIKIF